MKKKTSSPEKVKEVRAHHPMSIHPLNLNISNEFRIVVVVAEKLNYWIGKEQKVFKMEAGRIAAQAAHAVSKLKMRYVYDHTTEKMPSTALLYQLMGTPITTIVLGARDNNEVAHIANLASETNLLYSTFCDDNQEMYGTTDRILTAVAIGPIHKGALAGITDYLPLYKAAGEL